MQLENENYQFIATTQQTTIPSDRKTDHIRKNNRFYKILIGMKQEICGNCHEKNRDSDSEERGCTRVRWRWGWSFRWCEGRRASCDDVNAELLAEAAVRREGAREVELASAVESDYRRRRVE